MEWTKLPSIEPDKCFDGVKKERTNLALDAAK